VYIADYIKDPLENDIQESWDGVKGLIYWGAEEKFGPGTDQFLRDANERQTYMKRELFRRYGLENEWEGWKKSK
jgi:hypothetical protein